MCLANVLTATAMKIRRKYVVKAMGPVTVLEVLEVLEVLFMQDQGVHMCIDPGLKLTLNGARRNVMSKC